MDKQDNDNIVTNSLDNTQYDPYVKIPKKKCHWCSLGFAVR